MKSGRQNSSCCVCTSRTAVYAFLRRTDKHARPVAEQKKMKKWHVVAMVGAVAFMSTGCAQIRRMDQWKCDKLGICMPGITPSSHQTYSPEAPYLQAPSLPAPFPPQGVQPPTMLIE